MESSSWTGKPRCHGWCGSSLKDLWALCWLWRDHPVQCCLCLSRSRMDKRMSQTVCYQFRICPAEFFLTFVSSTHLEQCWSLCARGSGGCCRPQGLSIHVISTLKTHLNGSRAVTSLLSFCTVHMETEISFPDDESWHCPQELLSAQEADTEQTSEFHHRRFAVSWKSAVILSCVSVVLFAKLTMTPRKSPIRGLRRTTLEATQQPFPWQRQWRQAPRREAHHFANRRSHQTHQHSSAQTLIVQCYNAGIQSTTETSGTVDSGRCARAPKKKGNAVMALLLATSHTHTGRHWSTCVESRRTIW